MANPSNIGAALNTASSIAKVLVLGGATVWAGTNSLFNVEGGHRAIVFNRLMGVKETVRPFTSSLAQRRHYNLDLLFEDCDGNWAASTNVGGLTYRWFCAFVWTCQVYQEGTHIMVPWFERPVIYDVRARPSVIQSQSGSRDLQMVSRRLGTT